ncbi:MAG: zinc-ribbon domain-containing protein [Pseudomonadota bacterium]
MIIVCNSCSAQYSVNDAKVRGKLVRITCKHCATAIVVDGRNMSDAEAASQKPLASYPLRRRDESIVAHSPLLSVKPTPAVKSAPVHSPAPAPVQSAMSAAMHEEDRTMLTRSRFGDDMSVHDERTVIGQIPKEALEFERMFAQRTQPPPPEASGAPSNASPPATTAPSEPPLPSFSSSEPPAAPEAPQRADDEAESASSEGFSRSEPPTVGTKPTSDVRGLVSLAEATHPSVARTVTARRLRVTLITLLVLAVLVLLFVIQMPR